MSKQDQLVKNTLIIGVGKLSTQFLTFLLLPVYTVFLSPTDFGQIDIILIYISLLAPTLTAQMEMAVFRHLIDARGDSTKTSNIISSSSAVLLIGAIIGVISLVVFGYITSSSLSWYLVGLFLSAVFVNYLLQVARGLGKNNLYAIASIGTGLTNILVTCLALVIFRAGIEGVLLAGITGNLVGIFILVITTKYLSIIKKNYISMRETRELLQYSWPLIPNHVSLWGINGISRTIVAVVLGFAFMGIYAASARFSLIYTSLYSIFAMSWTEAVSVHIKDKNDIFFSKATDAFVRLFGSLGLVIVAVVALLFPILVADEFNSARQYIPILIVGAFFSSIVTHYGAVYLAVRKTKQIASITVQALIVSSALTLALINILGLYAPALALAVTYGYLALRRHYDVQKYIDIRYNTMTYPLLGVFGTFVIMLYFLNSLAASILALVVAVLGSLVINHASLGELKRMLSRKIITTRKRNN